MATRPGPHLVLAATHDLEAVGYLTGVYAAFHLADSAAPGGLSFDYRIRPGVSATKNAIGVLDLLGAPRSVVSAPRHERPSWTAREQPTGTDEPSTTGMRTSTTAQLVPGRVSTVSPHRGVAFFTIAGQDAVIRDLDLGIPMRLTASGTS